MARPDKPPVGRRALAGSDWELSEVTVSIDPPLNAPPSADARTVALLQRALERGVTSFDLSNARFPARAERLLSRAFRETSADVCVLVGRSVESLAREGSREGTSSARGDLPLALRASLEESQRRLGKVRVAVVVWDRGSDTDTRDEPTIPSSLAGSEKAKDALLATRVSTADLPSPGALGASPVYAGPFSLLDSDLMPLFESREKSGTATLIAEDPLAGGRLDGSRFAQQALLPGPGSGPTDVRHLHEEFDPVLRLGFLTEGRVRTLAQAALQFVLSWSWVATTVVPLPNPERFEELFRYREAPPLTEEDIRRVGLLK